VVQIHRETTSTISDVPLTSDLPNQASISDKVGQLPSDSTAEQYLEHFFTAMNNLANTLEDQGKLEEAAAMKKEVLEKRQRILGDEHPNTIAAMSNLANTLGDQGKLEEAAAMRKEVLEKRQRILRCSFQVNASWLCQYCDH
jgi:hypothetical protein